MKARWLFPKSSNREVLPWRIHHALEVQTLSLSWSHMEAGTLTLTNQIKIKVKCIRRLKASLDTMEVILIQ